MIRIAVLGDIGSGKSYVAKQFGYPVFNADIEVAKLYKKNKKCYKKLKKTFPKYISKFPINKNEISHVILAKKNNIKKIEKIIHPQIKKNLNSFISKNKRKKFVLLDIPLLIEKKLNRKNDILVFVQAKNKEVVKRLKKRKNFNKKIVKILQKLQLSLEYKKKISDFVVKNNFNNHSIKKNVKNILKNA
tara:strand:+ start:5477 stop:6043 length:567 start_codon:yes stop_codon:yes gene_type:complete